MSKLSFEDIQSLAAILRQLPAEDAAILLSIIITILEGK